MNKKTIFNKIFKALDRLFLEAKKIIRNNDNRYALRALASLFVFIFVICQAIKEFFFEKNLTASILLSLLIAYVTYNHFDEHVILTIAMLLCLYFAYDTITSLIKGEIKSRNDQIYKEFLNNTKEQVDILSKKRKMIKNLETFASSIEQIKNSCFIKKEKNGLDFYEFKPTVSLKQNLETVIYEELYYLDFAHNVKNNIFEKVSIELDKDLEFTNSKIEEISNN